MDYFDSINIEYSPGERTNLHLISMGSGPKILFLHGWLHSGRRWETIMQALCSKYELIAPDLPGFGNSAPLKKGFITIKTYSQIISQLAEILSTKNRIYAVVADSLGAILILKILNDEGLKDTKLLLSGCPIHGLPRPLKAISRLNLVSMQLSMIHKIPKRICDPLIRACSLATVSKLEYADPIMVEDVYRADPNTAGLILSDLCNSRIDEIPFITGSCNCTIVRGEKDLIVSKRSSMRLAEKLGADYIEISRARHTPMTENVEEFMAALNMLLNKNG